MSLIAYLPASTDEVSKNLKTVILPLAMKFSDLDLGPQMETSIDKIGVEDCN